MHDAVLNSSFMRNLPRAWGRSRCRSMCGRLYLAVFFFFYDFFASHVFTKEHRTENLVFRRSKFFILSSHILLFCCRSRFSPRAHCFSDVSAAGSRICFSALSPHGKAPHMARTPVCSDVSQALYIHH